MDRFLSRPGQPDRGIKLLISKKRSTFFHTTGYLMSPTMSVATRLSTRTYHGSSRSGDLGLRGKLIREGRKLIQIANLRAKEQTLWFKKRSEYQVIIGYNDSSRFLSRREQSSRMTKFFKLPKRTTFVQTTGLIMSLTMSVATRLNTMKYCRCSRIGDWRLRGKLIQEGSSEAQRLLE